MDILMQIMDDLVTIKGIFSDNSWTKKLNNYMDNNKISIIVWEYLF